MTRSELAEVVYRQHGGISRREAQALLDLILGLIRDHLAAGERVEIPGFGCFEVSWAGARGGRHPVTGRRFRVARRRTLTFRPSRGLEQRVNEAPAGEALTASMAGTRTGDAA